MRLERQRLVSCLQHDWDISTEVSGYGEIDVSKQRVAYNAPLMRAIMGLHIGDSAESPGPQGPVEYEIIALFASWEDVPGSLKKF